MDLSDIDDPEIAARRKMVKQLSDDLFYEGWDKPCKFWMILGKNDDPYLEFVGTYNMDPTHWMFHRAEEGQVRAHVLGVATCWESWAYPPALNDYIEEHRTNDASMAVSAYQTLVPPSRHPGRRNVRTVVTTFRDGVVLRAIQDEDGEPELEVMQAIEPTGPTGETLVDFMRHLIDICPLPKPEIPPMIQKILESLSGPSEASHE